MQRRTLLTTALATVLGAMGIALPVQAQDAWPSKTIRFVVPYPPGGPTDLMARLLQGELTKRLGVAVVVDNKGGAGGNLGSAEVAKQAPADGHTLLHTTIGAQTIAPHLMPSLPYDPLKDLEPVVLVGTIPHLLVVSQGQPFKSVTDLLGTAKAKGGEIAFASGGNGTILQMQAELLALDGATWLRVKAEAEEGAAATEEAKTIAARVTGWLYKLPQFKAGLLQPKIEDYLKQDEVVPSPSP